MSSFPENRPVGQSRAQRTDPEELRQWAKPLDRAASKFFFVAGCLILCVGAYLARKEMTILQTWPEVMAKVTNSGLSYDDSSPRTDSGSSYSLEVEFQYRVGGKEYKRWVKSSWGTGIRSVMEKRAAKFSPGSEHAIRYNPEDPADLHFDVGYNFETFGGSMLTGGLGLFLTIGLWIHLSKMKRSEQR